MMSVLQTIGIFASKIIICIKVACLAVKAFSTRNQSNSENKPKQINP